MNLNAAGQFQLGVCPVNTSLTTYSLNAAVNRTALGFIISDNKTLSSVSCWLSAVTGTLADTDIVCEIFSSNTANTYLPLTSLASSSSVSPTFAGNIVRKYTWSGFSLALTAGTMYYAVFSNVNATPASNFVSFQVIGHNQAFNANARYGQYSRTSTNSGSTWAAGTSYTGLRLDFSDSTGFGVTSQNLINGNSAWGTTWGGFSFVTPSVILYPALAQFNLTVAGSPPDLKVRIYEGTTQVLESSSSLTGQIGSNNHGFIFPRGAALKPNTLYRCAVGSPSSGSSGNNARVRYLQIESNEYSERPFAGTLQRTDFNGTSWTDTPTNTGFFSLFADADYPFQAPAFAY